MKNIFRIALFTITGLLFSATLSAQTIAGKVIDQQTSEPLIGVAVIVKGSTTGTSTDINGEYILHNVTSGSILEVSYISYKTIETDALELKAGEAYAINFSMESDDMSIESVRVVARKNLESEGTLKNERIKASYAIENLGAVEMKLKGISNVAEGVKKITGISTANSGQLFVRGLGDRYSITTLNGLPIASPNPDNKLIPLELFPSSVVKNITVSKVYNVSSFADYSGARIDIGTKESVGDDFLSVSFKTGMTFGTQFQDFYKGDGINFFSTDKVPSEVRDIDGTLAFREYAKENELFATTFSADKITALPDFGGSISGGKSWTIKGSNKLSLLASISASKESTSQYDSYFSVLNKQGVANSDYYYDTYATNLKASGLLSLGYNYGDGDAINYTMFYARDYTNEYKYRDGYFGDDRDDHFIGTSNVTRIYNLLYNQLAGHQQMGERFKLSWAAAYGSTGSDEPDRRQSTFLLNEDTGDLTLYSLNNQETMRYFGELDETEVVGDLKLNYTFGKQNLITVGGTYKSKNRDFSSIRFYYDLSSVNDVNVDNVFQTEDLVGYDMISNGSINLYKNDPSSGYYTASTDVYAAFAELDYYIDDIMLINVGVRYENVTSVVDYYDSGAGTSEIPSSDFFPTLNLKYNINVEHSLRFGASRTVTRPSFIEMAPFLYQESMGGEQIKGNADIENGYNINLDLRYEYFKDKSTDMISLAGYYKVLQNPIERVQSSIAGDDVLNTFRNADNGLAAGVELELRKAITPELKFNFNASYMYTNIQLPDDSGYTDTERMLQGASPYLMNADISYSKTFNSGANFSTALLYNLQGPRIHSVGRDGISNVMEQAFNMLNFTCSYSFPNNNWSINASVNNLLNSDNNYVQDVDGVEVLVQHYERGVGAELGLSYNF
ncbi:MAG: TonB-dependent receptor [Rikenellaceae bacterium]